MQLRQTNNYKSNINTQRHSLFHIALLLSSAAMVACSGSSHNIPEHRRVRKAPTSNKETGVIVSGISQEAIAEQIEKNENLKVRIVNEPHGLYEVFGATAEELRAAIQDPEVVVEKNEFVIVKDLKPAIETPDVSLSAPTPGSPAAPDSPAEPTPDNGAPATRAANPFAEAIENFQNLRLTGEAKTFAESCLLNMSKAPKITVKDDQRRDRFDGGILFNLGEKLNLDATASTTNPASSTAQSLKYMWLITVPDDSAASLTVSFESKVTYTPDTTGTYFYSIIARDNLNVCQIDAGAFYVSMNPKFKPVNPMPDSAADRIDLNMFWHLFHVGAQAAWTVAKGEGMIIGVIDSGVDYNHPALANNILINNGEIPDNGEDDDHNGFTDDYVGYDFGLDDGYPFDDFGHGTHVAGIAASNIFGAARKAKILVTKYGAGLGFDIATITGAIKYEIDRGAKVLNMSFGGEHDFEVLREAMNYAESKNILVVIASGNETNDNDTKPSFPDSYPNANIISVAATDENDALTGYSNFGAQRVHIGAPGGTGPKPIISSYKENPRHVQYVGLTGTSMAAPLVAGIAAEVWSANPRLTNIQLRKILIDTGKPSAALAGRIQSGKVIDAQAAMAAATQGRVHPRIDVPTRLPSSVGP